MATSVNKVILLGRLGRDPEIRFTKTGKAVASFNVATSERKKGDDGNYVEDTTWHRVEVWDKVAENCQKYLHKGSLVYVEGALLIEKWTDQQGQQRNSPKIRAAVVQFCDSRNDNGGGGQQRPQGNNSYQPQKYTPQNYQPPQDYAVADDYYQPNNQYN